LTCIKKKFIDFDGDDGGDEDNDDNNNNVYQW
jgi:hypothetical protein